jgi:hypothetical protein
MVFTYVCGEREWDRAWTETFLVGNPQVRELITCTHAHIHSPMHIPRGRQITRSYLDEIPALNHEVLYHTMESRALVSLRLVTFPAIMVIVNLVSGISCLNQGYIALFIAVMPLLALSIVSLTSQYAESKNKSAHTSAHTNAKPDWGRTSHLLKEGAFNCVKSAWNHKSSLWFSVVCCYLDSYTMIARRTRALRVYVSPKKRRKIKAKGKPDLQAFLVSSSRLIGA